jgi:hypothetical protein
MESKNKTFRKKSARAVNGRFHGVKSGLAFGRVSGIAAMPAAVARPQGKHDEIINFLASHAFDFPCQHTA